MVTTPSPQPAVETLGQAGRRSIPVDRLGHVPVVVTFRPRLPGTASRFRDFLPAVDGIICVLLAALGPGGDFTGEFAALSLGEFRLDDLGFLVPNGHPGEVGWKLRTSRSRKPR